MLLTLFRDRRGNLTARQGDQLFVLSDKTPLAKSDAVVSDGEFMIVSRLGDHPRGWLIEPVTDRHELIEHEGFITVGHLNRTYAKCVGEGTGVLTPGRVMDLLPVYDERQSNTQSAPVPGVVYVCKGENRATGLPSLDQLKFLGE